MYICIYCASNFCKIQQILAFVMLDYHNQNRSNGMCLKFAYMSCCCFCSKCLCNLISCPKGSWYACIASVTCMYTVGCSCIPVYIIYCSLVFLNTKLSQCHNYILLCSVVIPQYSVLVFCSYSFYCVSAAIFFVVFPFVVFGNFAVNTILLHITAFYT